MPLSTSQQFESEISKRVAEACEQVMARIATDLHDDLVQRLATFRLNFDKLERSSADPEIQTIAVNMKKDFERVIHAVRTVSRGLSLFRMGGDTLVTMLETLCRNMQHPDADHIHFTHEGAPVPVDKHAETHIFRIVQELIQNVLKHSTARHIWVRLQWQPETLTIEVEDDGSGVSQLQEFMGLLDKENSTSKLRSQTIGASISYAQGVKGLLARLSLRTR